jgi:hypothetical protein
MLLFWLLVAVLLHAWEPVLKYDEEVGLLLCEAI